MLGLDCGPGADGLVFVQHGIHFTGVDPSEEHIHSARARGLEASVADAAALPFPDAAFASVWAVDALAGLPPEQWDDVVRELGRVAEPGAPIAVVLPGPEHGLEEPGLRGDSRCYATPRPGRKLRRGAFTVLRCPRLTPSRGGVF